MTENRISFIVVLILLAATSLGIFVRFRMQEETAGQIPSSVWRIFYQITFTKLRSGNQVRIALPDTIPAGRISRESIDYSGLSISILRNRRTKCREVVAVPVWKDSTLSFNAEFDIQIPRRGINALSPLKSPLDTEDRAFFLRSETDIQIENQSVIDILAKLSDTDKAQSGLISNIFEFCAEDINLDTECSYGDALTTLLNKRGNGKGKAKAMVALCRASRIPARVVTGFVLEKRYDFSPHLWVEVYTKKQWFSYDPEYGYFAKIPETYISVRKDGAAIVKTGKSTKAGIDSRFSVELNPHRLTAATRKHILDIFDLTRLSMSMQETLVIIMLLVVGAFVTAVFRNMIGVKTFGTFTPSLLALSFVYKDILTGFIVFSVVLLIGVAGRITLSHLRLLLVPRLGVVLGFVVICLVLSVSLLAYLGLTPSAHAVLLPTVIFTMLIERFHITWEEQSFNNALKIFCGTLATSVVCLAVFKIRKVWWVLLEYPELVLAVVALLILVGRYSGYRLTELLRFKSAIPAKGE